MKIQCTTIFIEFSYSDVSASEDDALKQKVVKLKGQEHGTIRYNYNTHVESYNVTIIVIIVFIGKRKGKTHVLSITNVLKLQNGVEFLNKKQ